mmetsp:Transcript_26666/g.57744  ORF Transcript_26666/g.57744 Transcript_26666/m.57744 type:complete len:154 (+) Transcript_26666:678-1139(+)
MEYNFEVTIVDPQRMRLDERKASMLGQKLNPDKTPEELFLERGGKQVGCLFNADFCREDKDDLWSSCDLVLGLHPDQATDAIVDESLLHNKKFAVVPCCVFPSLFPNRRLKSGCCVRSRESLCEYLVEKDGARIKCEVIEDLPGPCNMVVYLN